MSRWMGYVESAIGQHDYDNRDMKDLIRVLEDLQTAMRFEAGRNGIGKNMLINGLRIDEFVASEGYSGIIEKVELCSREN
jgi:hypothetical protein